MSARAHNALSYYGQFIVGAMMYALGLIVYSLARTDYSFPSLLALFAMAKFDKGPGELCVPSAAIKKVKKSAWRTN